MPNQQRCDPATYVLLTAAYNEAAFIGKTIKSVQSQSVPPAQWVMVSDGSSDETDKIIREHAAFWPVIKPIRRERSGERGFASKVKALALAHLSLSEPDYRFIGHVDADVTFDSKYFERLIARCLENPELGLCGGTIYEPRNGRFKCRPYNSSSSVAGAVQFFRRGCYERIGGLPAMEAGGEDTYAEVMARMMGWDVRSFAELIVIHNKSGKPRGLISESIRKGTADHAIGNHPLFEFAKCIYRLAEAPYMIGSLLRFASFIYAQIKGETKEVSDEFVKYFRHEQVTRMRSFLFRSLHRVHKS